MSQELNERQPVENWKIFSARNVIAIAIHLIIASFYLSNLSAKIERLNEISTDIKRQQEKDGEDSKAWHASVENDIASLKLRMAIIEQQIKQNEKH